MNGGLWHRPTQTDLLISKLREARAEGKALELPEIMRLGIAQHGARLNELRSRGFVIENEMSRHGDTIRSCYWLKYDPEQESAHGR